eukprot:TRINITY_DN19323_c0_g1_i1.p2 TRINITY_DN19323_c0_g1~~TRINITY_DN19323_c0_g1_i1.p2  ORF type:complete len:130 (+),score=43.90 TRINITY_DN19323_c0_g1_i1:125-514(+)
MCIRDRVSTQSTGYSCDKVMGCGASTQPAEEWDGDRAARLEQIFAEVDDNQSGTVDTKEYKQLLRDGSPEGMVAVVFDMADENSDGALSVEEFVSFNLNAGKALSDPEFKKQTDVWLKLARDAVTLTRG